MCQDKVQKLLEKSKKPLNLSEIEKRLNISRGAISKNMLCLVNQKIAKIKTIRMGGRNVPHYYL